MQGTNGQKSLDDAMRLLYDEYYKKQNRGFTDIEFQQAIEKTAGKSMDGFFKNHVYGIQQPDYDRYFGYVGLRLDRFTADPQTGFLGAATAFANGRLTVGNVRKGSAAYQYGLNVNDEIIAVDGYRVGDDFQQFVNRRKAGEKLTLLISRAGMVQSMEVTLGSNPSISYRIERLPNPTAQQAELLKKWVR